MDALAQAFERAASSGSRVVILTGAGDRAFAAGADVTELTQAMATPTAARQYDARVTAMYDAIAACPCPVIARLNGHAVGGGLLLALACDLRVATPAIKMGLPAGRIGLMLSPREYELVDQNLSPSRAKLLLCAGTIIQAPRAQEWGLVDELAEAGQLDEAVHALAAQIEHMAPRSVAAAKKLLGLQAHNELAAARAIADTYRSVYSSDDLREGISAFLQKREPRFTGK